MTEHEHDRRPWIGRIGPEQAEGELAEAYRSIGGGLPLARIIEIHTLHPQSMLDHYALYRTSMYGPSPLSRAEREAIAGSGFRAGPGHGLAPGDDGR